jgi:hypothetical protein
MSLPSRRTRSVSPVRVGTTSRVTSGNRVCDASETTSTIPRGWPGGRPASVVPGAGNTGALKPIRLPLGASPTRSIRMTPERATARQVSENKGFKGMDRRDCITTVRRDPKYRPRRRSTTSPSFVQNGHQFRQAARRGTSGADLPRNEHARRRGPKGKWQRHAHQPCRSINQSETLRARSSATLDCRARQEAISCCANCDVPA